MIDWTVLFVVAAAALLGGVIGYSIGWRSRSTMDRSRRARERFVKVEAPTHDAVRGFVDSTYVKLARQRAERGSDYSDTWTRNDMEQHR